MKLKKSVKQLLKSIHRHHKSQPDIYIFSLPRSGSTLLAEVLNSNSASKTASEVFSLTENNRSILKQYFNEDFFSERYTDISAGQYQQMLRYFSELSHGKSWNSFYWSDLFTKYHHYKTSRTIFKTHRINYHFDSLMTHFENDFGIYLLRHPVPVSLSRMKMGWTTYIDQYEKSIKLKGSISNGIKDSIQEIKEKGSELEKQVLNWCLENLVFIQHFQNNTLPKNVTVVYYENLVLAPEKTLMELCSKVKMAFHPEMLKIMQQPSTGIVHSKKEVKNEILEGNNLYLVNNWKSEVNNQTLKRIHILLKRFGFEFYLE